MTRQTMQRIVDAARALTDARYAAIGIFDGDGALVDFVHSGLPDEHATQIDHLPRGIGLLGEMKRSGAAVHSPDVSNDARAAGFPEHHPEMRSFLGVPIRLGDALLGHLYLADAPNGFDTDTEQRVQALAEVAGVAVHNSTLLAREQRRKNHLQANADIAVALLSDMEPEEALGLVAAQAQRVLHADAAVLVLPNLGDAWVVEIASGSPAGRGLIGTVMPPGGRTSRIVGGLKGLIVQDLSSVADLGVEALREFGPALYAPLGAHGEMVGVLLVLRAIGAPEFTDDDLSDAESFARQAAMAMLLADGRRNRELAGLVEQRTEIARDLHDFVVQEMFATGAGLSGLISKVEQGNSPGEEDLREVLSRLDTAVIAVRQAIRSLRDQGAPTSLMDRVHREVHHAGWQLGYRPTVETDDATATAELDPALVEDLAAIVREALSNVARHAHADHASVRVATADNRLTLEIQDDGRGLASPLRRSGLGTMEERAQRNGGTMTLVSTKGLGTTVVVEVPMAMVRRPSTDRSAEPPPTPRPGSDVADPVWPTAR